jgi:hypothetical protein
MLQRGACHASTPASRLWRKLSTPPAGVDQRRSHERRFHLGPDRRGPRPWRDVRTDARGHTGSADLGPAGRGPPGTGSRAWVFSRGSLGSGLLARISSRGPHRFDPRSLAHAAGALFTTDPLRTLQIYKNLFFKFFVPNASLNAWSEDRPDSCNSLLSNGTSIRALDVEVHPRSVMLCELEGNRNGLDVNDTSQRTC